MRITTPPTRIVSHRANEDRTDVRQSRITDHSAPGSFEELYDRYYGYVVRLIKKRGIHHNDVEDVAQIILTHFYRRNSLDYFEPDYTVEVNGESRNVRFTTFLSGFVITYLQHYLAMQDKAEARNVHRLDVLVDGDPLSEDSWANVRGPRYEADFSQPEYVELVDTIHGRLAQAESRSSGACDLAALFEAMREQIAITGKYNTAELAERFGAPVSTIQNWIKRLRTELVGL